MILSIILIVLLISAFARGWRRGSVIELLYLLGYALTLAAAWLYYQRLGAWLLDVFQQSETIGAHYLANWGAFILISFIGTLLVRGIARASKAITWIPVIHQVNGFAGALLGLLLAYFWILLILALMLLIPTGWLQDQYQASVVAQFMVQQTPILTGKLLQDWLGASLQSGALSL